MRPLPLLLAGAALAALVPAALAHEFWIQPASFRPALGDVQGLALRIGHPAAPEAYARNPQHVAAFVLAGPLGAASEGVVPRRDVPGREGADPAGLVRLAAAGRYVVGYRSHPSTVEMQPADFEAYLREKGLEGVIAERRARGESELPGREAFSRCAKALLRTPEAAAGPPDVALGFPVELVLLDDPLLRAEAEAGPAPLAVRLLVDGEPRPGALVHAEPLDPGAEAGGSEDGSGPGSAGATGPLSAWTDARGEVRLPLPAEGSWLVTSVHAVRAPEEEGGADVEWRSTWASLTFSAEAR
jgi:uncharacterized GH25 family protein